MRKTIIIGAILLLILCLGFGFFFFGREGTGITYEGVLPGADCAGLKTELTLYQDGSYFLKETYLATRDGDKTFTSNGKWQKRASRGRAVIQLCDKKNELTNYLVVDQASIKLVDKQGKDIDCPFNLTLKKKK